MTVADSLAAVGAYGIVVLVLDKMSENYNKEHLPIVRSENLLFYMYGVIFRYLHVWLPLIGLWLLSARLTSITITAEFLRIVEPGGSSRELIEYCVTLALLSPVMFQSMKIIRLVYEANDTQMTTGTVFVMMIPLLMNVAELSMGTLTFLVFGVTYFAADIAYAKRFPSMRKWWPYLAIAILVVYLVDN